MIPNVLTLTLSPVGLDESQSTLAGAEVEPCREWVRSVLSQGHKPVRYVLEKNPDLDVKVYSEDGVSVIVTVTVPQYADEGDVKGIKDLFETAFGRFKFTRMVWDERVDPVCDSCGCVISNPYDAWTYQSIGPDESGVVCIPCHEQDLREPSAWVTYGDARGAQCTIGHYHDDTEGDFKLEYVRIDGWRGHFEIRPSGKWKEVRSDGILAHSQDESDLKDFDTVITGVLDRLGIKWARVVTRSSNVFYCPYYLFVGAEQAEAVSGAVEEIAKKYRDPAKYAITALTGTDPEDCTPEDKMFAVLASVALAKDRTHDEE